MKTLVLFAVLVELLALEETTLTEFKLGNNLFTSDIYKVSNFDNQYSDLVTRFLAGTA